MQKNRKIVLSILMFFTFITAFCQNEETPLKRRAKKYAFILYLNGGVGYFPSKSVAPAFLNPRVFRVNPVTTARIMWKPDHRLKAGLEAGYMTFYSYHLTDAAGKGGKVSFDAIPILLEFSVSVKKHFNLFAGSGVYILKTNLDYEGKTKSSTIKPGWMASADYTIPITKKFSLGTEAKWLYASETSRGSFGLQLQATWRFFRW